MLLWDDTVLQESNSVMPKRTKRSKYHWLFINLTNWWFIIELISEKSKIVRKHNKQNNKGQNNKGQLKNDKGTKKVDQIKSN